MKRALFSVYKKDGVEEIAMYLEKKGYEIISSGGTYKYLRDKGVNAKEIGDITGFPEVLGGRVKTLHPIIHSGILAVRDDKCHIEDMSKQCIEPIDFVVVSLYPFEETSADPKSKLEDIIEQIDIGGVTLIRAAAKNYKFVTVLTDPADYSKVIHEIDTLGDVSSALRLDLAAKAFSHTAYYDGLISTYFNLKLVGTRFAQQFSIPLKLIDELRYGENPHQLAALYQMGHEQNYSVFNADILGGKKLSYNNMMDGDAALDILREFATDRPFAVVIKHTNPCGASLADSIDEAYEKAWACDPASAFGGIIGFNGKVELPTAKKIGERFYEIVIATDYAPEALEELKKKQNLRILKLNGNDWSKHGITYRTVEGGMLLQEWDKPGMSLEKWEVRTDATPTQQLEKDLRFAWKIGKYVKSNAVVFVKNEQTVGVGAGQMSRVDSTRIATQKAKDNGFDINGSAMASDAYFPFRDSVDTAAGFGVKAIIQPGGSIRDQESIDAANEHKIAMVFTGIRHFKH